MEKQKVADLQSVIAQKLSRRCQEWLTCVTLCLWDLQKSQVRSNKGCFSRQKKQLFCLMDATMNDITGIPQQVRGGVIGLSKDQSQTCLETLGS